MKSFLLLLCSTLVLGLSTSESDNFKIINGQVIWQKVYDTDLTKKQLIEAIKTSSYFENISIVNEKKLIAKVNQLSLDYKNYGASYFSTPNICLEYHVNTFAVIEFRDKKYRVTLKSIKLIKNNSDSSCQEITRIEYHILNKDNTVFEKFFLKKPSKIFDFTFQKITDLNNIVEDDKW